MRVRRDDAPVSVGLPGRSGADDPVVRDRLVSASCLSGFPGAGQRRVDDAVVATAFGAATEAGLEMLRAGGNAVDAAAAAAWALAVCEPSGSGLGGQATVLICLADGRTVVVDGDSHAPRAVSRKRVTRWQQHRGHRAATVPSMPAVLGYVQRRYGELSPARVFAPAICLAEEGYRITRLQRRQLRVCLEALCATPATRRLFLKNGRPFRVGGTFRQGRLARTLRRLAEQGTDDFYHGELARAIERDMSRHDGLMTAEDLAAGAVPVEHAPLSIRYRGHRVLSVPPPGGGLQVLTALRLLDRIAPEDLAGDRDRWYETMAEATYAVFRERERCPVHPRDLTPSLLDWLLGDEHVERVTRTMDAPGCEGGASEEAGETTHLCAADRQGNVVALTQSIQSLFGAKVANAELGFLYNNYLCTSPRRRHPYRLGSRCVPRSNAAPTVVLSDACTPLRRLEPGHQRAWSLRLALGAAGSRRITSAILQVVSAVVDRGLSVTDAVAAPRLHALVNRDVWVERPAVTPVLQDRLERKFRRLEIRAPLSFSMAAVQALEFHADGTVSGAADPRRDGMAAGL